MEIKKLKVGDLIRWQTFPRKEFVAIGTLARRFDIFREMKISSRTGYEPKYYWYIIFSGTPPSDYCSNIGVSEEGLLSGLYGKIIQAETK